MDGSTESIGTPLHGLEGDSVVKIPKMILPPGMTFWSGLQKGYVGAIKSPAYLGYVASLPCCVSGQVGVTVHHIVGHGLKGNGEKTSDLLAIPLAPHLHLPGYPEGLHHMGHKAWELKYGSQVDFAARTLLQAVYDGVLTL